MPNKYSCPNCGKELSEADVVRGICPHCHKIFDRVEKSGREANNELTEQKYCSNCGKEIDKDTKFCPHCGVSLTANEVNVSENSIQYQYAGFWWRFIAMIIDTIILLVPAAMIRGVCGFIIGYNLGEAGVDMATIKTVAEFWGSIIGIIIYWLYFTLMESSPKRATLGKMAVGVTVTDLDGKRISFGRANGRYWGKIISGIILLVGYIMAGFTEKRQALHDIMAECLVIKK